MSNHYHLVLHIDEQQNESLTDEEVCERWCQPYSKPVLVERWQSKQATSEAENKAVLTIINGWRGRLADISWFMRCHPWRSPFRPAKAVLICSLQISGKGVLLSYKS